MNTEEGIELPVVDNDGNVDDVENDTTDSNQDNQDNQDNRIQPYIKFYLYDKEHNIGPEEICLDYTLKVENDKWKVEIADSTPINLWMKVK